MLGLAQLYSRYGLLRCVFCRFTHMTSFLRSKAFLVAAERNPFALLSWNTQKRLMNDKYSQTQAIHAPIQKGACGNATLFANSKELVELLLTCGLSRRSRLSSRSQRIICMRSQELVLKNISCSSYRAARSWWSKPIERERESCDCHEPMRCVFRETSDLQCDALLQHEVVSAAHLPLERQQERLCVLRQQTHTAVRSRDALHETWNQNSLWKL